MEEESIGSKLQEQLVILQKQVGTLIKSKKLNFNTIRPDKIIKIVSLVDHELNLSTQWGGRGYVFRFDHFGQTKKINFLLLRDIVENHYNFLQQGKFYIVDGKSHVIEELGLEEIYANILSKEQIESILNSTIELPEGKSFEDEIKYRLDLFKIANQYQQKTIATILIHRIVNGMFIHPVLVEEISKITEIDIMKKVFTAIEDMNYDKKLIEDEKLEKEI
jgi:hypothetical protein